MSLTHPIWKDINFHKVMHHVADDFPYFQAHSLQVEIVRPEYKSFISLFVFHFILH